MSGASDAAYYSFYPYGHLAFFWPFTDWFGAYAGLGGGFMIVSYSFDKEGDYSENIPAAAATIGANFLDMINISYTLKTNFSARNHKVSAGYTYRFK